MSETDVSPCSPNNPDHISPKRVGLVGVTVKVGEPTPKEIIDARMQLHHFGMIGARAYAFFRTTTYGSEYCPKTYQLYKKKLKMEAKIIGLSVATTFTFISIGFAIYFMKTKRKASWKEILWKVGLMVFGWAMGMTIFWISYPA